MNKVAINNSQNKDHFSRQSPSKSKTVQINYGDSYHFQNQVKRQSSSHKRLSPFQKTFDSPQKFKVNNQNLQQKPQQLKATKKDYDSPDKEENHKRVLNKQNSLNLSQCSLSQNGQDLSKRKIEGNSSMVHFDPLINQKSPRAVGQTPKFFSNGKSIQISTINSIPNISWSQANWTGTDFESQIFGPIKKKQQDQESENMIKLCSKQLEKDPTNLKIYQKRVQLYYKAGDYDNFFKDSSYILNRDPKNALVMFLRGNVLMQKGEIEKAIADFEKVLSIDPDNVNAALARASCWNIKGEYIKAIDQYEDALEKDIEKTSMLNLSINLKRNFKSTTSSQTCHLDRLEKEELQFGSEQKLYQFNSPFLEVKKLQSQVVGSKSENPYQNLQRSQSDQVKKEEKNINIGQQVKSFNGSECQSPIIQNKSNQIIQQSVFGKVKLSNNTEQQDISKQTNNTDSEEKINEQANFYFTKGFCARQRKDYWKAIELYSHALSLKPDFLKAVFNRGFLFDKLDQYEKACEDYTRSIQIDQKCSFAYFNRGISFNKLKRYEDALSDFTKAIELDNTNSDFYLNRANTYQKLDMHKEAIKDYTSCIDFQTSKLPSVLISRAMSYEKNSEIERAKHDYQRAIDIGTNQPQICYSRLATIFFQGNNYQQALTLYNKSLELEPNSIYCLAKRAQLYIKLELYKLASEDLTAAINIKDDIDALYYYRGKAFKQMGKLIESTEDLLRASNLNPKDPNIFRLLSKNMLDLDQYEDSINYINKEIEIIGKSKQSIFNRAFCYNKLNKFEEAEKDLQELLQEDKDNIKLQKSISICLLNLKKYEEAIVYLNAVIQKVNKPEVSEFYKYRSDCFLHLQNKQKAEEDLIMYQKTKNQN